MKLRLSSKKEIPMRTQTFKFSVISLLALSNIYFAYISIKRDHSPLSDRINNEIKIQFEQTWIPVSIKTDLLKIFDNDVEIIFSQSLNEAEKIRWFKKNSCRCIMINSEFFLNYFPFDMYFMRTDRVSLTFEVRRQTVMLADATVVRQTL